EGTVGTGGVASLPRARRVLLRNLLERNAGPELRDGRGPRRGEESRAILDQGDGRRWLPARRHTISGRGGRTARRHARNARIPARVRIVRPAHRAALVHRRRGLGQCWRDASLLPRPARLTFRLRAVRRDHQRRSDGLQRKAVGWVSAAAARVAARALVTV